MQVPLNVHNTLRQNLCVSGNVSAGYQARFERKTYWTLGIDPVVSVNKCCKCLMTTQVRKMQSTGSEPGIYSVSHAQARPRLQDAIMPVIPTIQLFSYHHSMSNE